MASVFKRILYYFHLLLPVQGSHGGPSGYIALLAFNVRLFGNKNGTVPRLRLGFALRFSWSTGAGLDLDLLRVLVRILTCVDLPRVLVLVRNYIRLLGELDITCVLNFDWITNNARQREQCIL